MRLATVSARPQLSGSPLASLALLVLALVMINGLFAAARGPGLRFATPTEPRAFAETRPVVIRILPGGVTEVDGRPVDRAGLADAVAAGSASTGGPAALLVVSPEATYGDMVAAYAAVVSVPNVQVAIPTRAWVEAKTGP
jgi:biopolymer transport protein ExbD